VQGPCSVGHAEYAALTSVTYESAGVVHWDPYTACASACACARTARLTAGLLTGALHLNCTAARQASWVLGAQHLGETTTLAAACAACMHRADMSARVGSRIQRLGCRQGRVRVTRQSASNRDERETIAGYDGAVCPLPGPRVAQYLPKATPFIQQTQRTSPRAQRDPTHTCT
jgi:hypothetical protein